jgi:hypothetical protein
MFPDDGVPLISPVAAFKSKPAGGRGPVPQHMVQVYGGVPPVALSVAEYGTPTIPYGRLVVVMVGPLCAISIAEQDKIRLQIRARNLISTGPSLSGRQIDHGVTRNLKAPRSDLVYTRPPPLDPASCIRELHSFLRCSTKHRFRSFAGNQNHQTPPFQYVRRISLRPCLSGCSLSRCRLGALLRLN